jgi:hypothetical protein
LGRQIITCRQALKVAQVVRKPFGKEQSGGTSITSANSGQHLWVLFVLIMTWARRPQFNHIDNNEDLPVRLTATKN